MVESPPRVTEEQPAAGKMELRLVVWPDGSLGEPVHGFSDEQIKSKLVRNTAGAMIRAMYSMHGIGLAAQQVGVPGAMFVLDVNWHTSGRKVPKIFLNPVMLEFDGGVVEMAGKGEGCLSTPYGFFAPVARSERVLLEWTGLDGETYKEWFDGVESIAIQHEVDHLHGVLFIERLSRLKQDIFKRKARKIRRRYKQGYERTKRELALVAKTEKRLTVAKVKGAERVARHLTKVEAADRAIRIEIARHDQLFLEGRPEIADSEYEALCQKLERKT
jgi:peptide deformylase